MKLGTTLRLVITAAVVAVIGYSLFSLGRSPAKAQSPAGSDDSLFQPEATTITEFPLPNPGRSPNKIGCIQNISSPDKTTVENSINEFPIPTASSLSGIVALSTSTGDVWFAETSANKIGRFTQMSGSPFFINCSAKGIDYNQGTCFTESPLPTANSSPFDIRLGFDNA